MNPKAGATARGPKNLQSTEAWHAIEEEFLARGDASRAQKAFTLAIDEVVVKSYRAVIEPVFPESLAMLAGGAYGLGQTFPYSDLDIVLLLDSGKQSDALKELLPEMVRLLWNAGLRVNSRGAHGCGVPGSRGAGEHAGIQPAGPAASGGRPGGLRKARGPAGRAHCRCTARRWRQRLCELARGRHARYQNTPLMRSPT